MNNYPNCPKVEDLSEDCLEAEEGYFILKGLKGTKKCSESVEHCLTCSRTDPSVEPICSLCQGELTPFQDPTQECRCPIGQYYDPQFTCILNVVGCKVHQNITGVCIEPEVGYYLDDEANPVICSTMLGCLECDRSGEGNKPLCTLCLHTAVFDAEMNECKRVDCSEKQWYTTDMQCSNNHEGCKTAEHKLGTCLEPEVGYYIRKADKLAELCSVQMEHCLECLREGEVLTPTCSVCSGDLQTHFSPVKCECQKREYYDEESNCLKNPEHCTEAESITGTCLKADDGYYITKDKLVEACIVPDPFCKSCEDGTGLCKVCIEGYGLNFSKKLCQIDDGPITDFTEPEKTISDASKSAKVVVEATGASLAIFGSAAGVQVAKAIQQSTLYSYVNVEKPRNFRIALEGLNSNTLGFIPNPFYDEKFEEAKASQKTTARTLALEDSEDERCTTNSIMRKTELSCYFLISKTSVLLFFLCFVGIKILLFTLAWIILRGYSKQIDEEEYQRYLTSQQVTEFDQVV